jgi:hypothetical protein
MAKKDITSLVQRLESFEDRAGVRIEAWSAFQEGPDDDDDGEVCISVFGELHTVNGTTLQDDIELSASFYDAEGRVIGIDSDYVEADSFFEFHTFAITCYVPSSSVHRIRLVPKPQQD